MKDKFMRIELVVMIIVLLIGTSIVSSTGIFEKEIPGQLNLEVKDNIGDSDKGSAIINIVEPYFFVHITDTHIGAGKSRFGLGISIGSFALNNFKKCIDYINSIEKKPEFIIISGDNVQYGNLGLFSIIWYQRLVEILKENNITYYFCPGNHDYNFGGNLKNYQKYIDVEYQSDDYRYSITHINTHIISMNSGSGFPKGRGLTDEDIKWLNNTLDGLDGVIDWEDNSNLNKVIFMHHPVINYGGSKGGKWDSDCISQNIDEFISLCETYDVDLVLTGHTHDNTIYKSGDIGNNEDGQTAPIICTETLYVQTADCKYKTAFRKITINGDELTVEIAEEAP